MPCRVLIDDNVNCVFIQHYESFTSGEGIQVLQRVLKDPAHKKDMNVLHDVTQLSLPDEYDLQWFRENVRKESTETMDINLGRGRKAAWILSNPRDFKVIHQWSVVDRLNTSVVERRPFRDIEKAKEWLEIPTGYVIDYADQPI
tara:strand:+ start:7781 stop:8212 length:432 start_codon:yes stop_codon:yes gene_type:complete